MKKLTVDYINKIDQLCKSQEIVLSNFNTIYIKNIKINPYCAYTETSYFNTQYRNWHSGFTHSLKGSPLFDLFKLGGSVAMFFYLIKYYYEIQWTNEQTEMVRKIKKKENIGEEAKLYLKERFIIPDSLSDKIFFFIKTKTPVIREMKK